MRRARPGGQPRGRDRRHQLDLAGLLLVSPLLVTAGQAVDPGSLAMTAGLGHTVAGPLHLFPGPLAELRREEMRGCGLGVSIVILS